MVRRRAVSYTHLDVYKRQLQDDDIEKFRDGQVHPLVEAGAHPLGMWMAVIRIHAELRKLRAAKSEIGQPNTASH